MKLLKWFGARKKPEYSTEIIEHLPHGRIRVRLLEDGKQIGMPVVIITSPPSCAYFAIPYAH